MATNTTELANPATSAVAVADTVNDSSANGATSNNEGHAARQW